MWRTAWVGLPRVLRAFPWRREGRSAVQEMCVCAATDAGANAYVHSLKKFCQNDTDLLLTFLFGLVSF